VSGMYVCIISLCMYDAVTKIKTNMLRWFGHVERMDERRLTKGSYETVLSGNIVKGST
jgi:hypothetical protein